MNSRADQNQPLEPGVHIFDADEQLNIAAAALFTHLICDAHARRGICTVALAGGSTPARLYRLLSQAQFAKRIPWQRTHIFWSDERCVPPDHPDSNFLMARTTLLDRVRIPESNVHRIQAAEGQEKAAAEYEQEICDLFETARGHIPRFDLIHLGIGEDGHTASLFPGEPELNERERLVVPTQKPGGWRRISFSLPLINGARNVIFTATGEGKADALSRSLGEPDLRTPASLVRPEGNLFWLIDAEAVKSVNVYNYDRH